MEIRIKVLVIIMNKISKYELFSLTVLLCGSVFPGIAAGSCIRIARSTSLIAIILGFLLGGLILFAVSFINKHIKGESIFDFKSNKNIFLRIIALSILIVALIILFLNSWTLINFFISQLLKY